MLAFSVDELTYHLGAEILYDFVLCTPDQLGVSIVTLCVNF